MKHESAKLLSAQEYLASYQTSFRVFYNMPRPGMHYHDFHELIIVLEGSGIHRADGEPYPVNRGDVFVILPGVEHSYTQVKDLRLANVLFDPKKFSFDLDDLDEVPGYYALFETEPRLRKKNKFKGKNTLSAATLGRIDKLVAQIIFETTHQAPGWSFAARVLFQELLLSVARSYGETTEKHSVRMVQLSLMLKFIEEHYHEDIALDDIAAQAHVSLSTALRIFKDFLSETPIRHMIRIRIQHSSELLRGGGIAIHEAAFRCGFHDSNYFALQFKKEYGVTPREYARQHE